jgi:hypothetical protein
VKKKLIVYACIAVFASSTKTCKNWPGLVKDKCLLALISKDKKNIGQNLNASAILAYI